MGDARHDISPELLARVRASFAEHALALFPGPAAT